jgi:Tfp pilus assembly PilM family ATPase
MGKRKSTSLVVYPHKILFLEAVKEKGSVSVQSASVIQAGSRDKETVASEVAQVFKKNKIKDKMISSSIWASSIIVRRILMPAMTPLELSKAIRYEAEKHIPFSIDDCYLDHALIQKLPSGNQMEVMLVAAQKDIVDTVKGWMTAAGMDMNFMDIHPFALSNLFCHTREKPANTTALVYMGDKRQFSLSGPNFVVILKGKDPVVVRDLGEADAKGEGDYQEALDRLTETLVGSIGFFENSIDKGLDEVCICGPGSSKESMVKHLSEQTDHKLKEWEYLSQITTKGDDLRSFLKQHDSDFVIPMGLAVRGLDA